MKQNLIIAIVALFALAGGVAVQNITAVSAGPSTQTENGLDFSLPDISGTVRNIEEWRGKILIVNFWATWCPLV
nr:hypothetical protein [Methylomarinum sp. Ch1-1]MDP4522251.1 hypothetical protein [Methylomarinum sp. Ch1-1]